MQSSIQSSILSKACKQTLVGGGDTAHFLLGTAKSFVAACFKVYAKALSEAKQSFSRGFGQNNKCQMVMAF